MTRIEDRLRDALAEEADATSVDALRMRDELTDRLEVRPRRRRTLPMAAAAVLVAGGLAVGVQTLGDDDHLAEPASKGEVDGEFNCPATEQVDLSGAQDEFLPDLTRATPAELAREYAAPRWEFVEDGETALLRLGNVDGTLGSETRYRRDDGQWKMVAATACGNDTPAAPTSDALRLGVHGGEPWPATGALNVGNPQATPVLVDDRPVYDHSGLVTRHRSIYLAPCGPHVCFAVGEPTSVVLPRLRAFLGRDTGILDTMCSFFTPDDMVGRDARYAVMVGWDAVGRTTGFTVAGPEGTYDGVSYTDPSWGSLQIWLALVQIPPPGVRLLARLHDVNGLVDQAHEPVRCD